MRIKTGLFGRTWRTNGIDGGESRQRQTHLDAAKGSAAAAAAAAGSFRRAENALRLRLLSGRVNVESRPDFRGFRVKVSSEIQVFPDAPVPRLSRHRADAALTPETRLTDFVKLHYGRIGGGGGGGDNPGIVCPPPPIVRIGKSAPEQARERDDAV